MINTTWNNDPILIQVFTNMQKSHPNVEINVIQGRIDASFRYGINGISIKFKYPGFSIDVQFESMFMQIMIKDAIEHGNNGMFEHEKAAYATPQTLATWLSVAYYNEYLKARKTESRANKGSQSQGRSYTNKKSQANAEEQWWNEMFGTAQEGDRQGHFKSTSETGYGHRTYQQPKADTGDFFSSRGGPTIAQCAQVLGVAVGASQEKIKAAYKAKAKEWHPDSGKHAGPDAIIMMQKINISYNTLKR